MISNCRLFVISIHTDADESEDNSSQTDDATPPSLAPFEPGQVYYKSMASQVLVLPESDVSVVEVQS